MSKYEITTDIMTGDICEGCPLVKVTRGGRDSMGVPYEPDSATCPVDFELADSLEWDRDNFFFYCSHRGIE